MGQPKLNFLTDERLDLLRDRKITEGLNELKSNVKDMDINVEVEKPPAEPAEPSEPRYTKESLSQMARRLYRENIKPVIDEPETEVKRVTNTYSDRVNGKALAKALVGMRNPDNGDDGAYAPPAGPNGGNMTGPSGAYHALTTSMSLEEYEDYINSKFLVEDEESVEETIEEPEFLVEENPAIEELEQALVEMSDISWVSIDRVMRSIARDNDITPKELHKEFKAKHGMIPDDWAEENQITEECGWMPLEEAVALNKVGQVFEVSYMFRCVTKRVKFFWPQVTYPSQKEMQEVVTMLYPGARVLAYYPSTDCGDNKDNFMVLVGPSTPRSVVLSKEDWEPMTSGESYAYEMILTEEGEPSSPPMMTPNGLVVMIEDYDTGEERTVSINSVEGEYDVVDRYKISSGIFFGEGKRGLWDNIHAKRKRGESPAKKGDKDYPKTLNVEDYKSDKNYRAPKVPAKKKPYDKIASFSMERPLTRDMKEDMSGMSQKSGDKRSTESGAGMTSAGVKKYNNRTGGNLKTAVTTPPSKLKAGSKAAGRRKSFCARSRGWNGERGKAARRRWNC